MATNLTSTDEGGSSVKALGAAGQSAWLDELSRPLVDGGGLDELVVNDGVSGVTSNPTIFEKALAEGDAYDRQLADLLADNPNAGDKDLYLELSGEDVRRACARLRPTWNASGGVDGWTSWEVDPRLADDKDATLAEVRRLRRLARAPAQNPNLFVKIPATDAGVHAIEDAVARGDNINVTLIFSLQRHAQVIEAYLRGLERFALDGGDVSRVHSVASFFVSRVDTEADKRLAAVGHEDLAGRLGVANAKLAYQQYLRAFRGRRWQELAARGAHVQRCLWASTSMKNPKARDVLYVEQLIGKETVTTLPRQTLDAFRDHGVVAATLERGLDDAKRIFDDVRAAGVDYDDVCRALEAEGVRKFADSLRAVLARIRDKRTALDATSRTSPPPA